MSFQQITIELLEDYVNNLKIQEAEKRTNALTKTKNTALITEATATAIEDEKNITPKNMVTLIDKRAAITVSKLNKSILKNTNVNKIKNKKKRKRSNGSERTETSKSSSIASLS